jgi:2-methylisocitrate lyase-like PEP mutase family enzyme
LDAGVVVAPTAYDMVAARVIEQAGFPAVFCSGYGQAASALGLPDGGLMTLDLLAQRVEAMARTVAVPVLVDADTGYEDPGATVRMLAAAGASAVMIEDQVPAKRCGHVAGKQVVAVEELVERIASAAAARPAGLLLIARTDALEPHGVEDALERGRRCAEAGADVVFVEAPESVEQMRAIAQTLPCPAMANVLPGGRTPQLSVAQLDELGFRLVVFGLVDLMLATAALRDGFAQLAASGDLAEVTTPRLGFEQLNALTGLTAHVGATAG